MTIHDDIFGVPPDDTEPSVEDTAQGVAGEVLVKLAAEQGVALPELPEADLKRYVDSLRDARAFTPSPELEKDAGAMPETKTPETATANDAALFNAYVMQVAIKTAAAASVDFSQLSVEEAAQLTTAIAEEILADPEAHKAKIAAEEAKIAADAKQAAEEAATARAGEIMAESFYRQLSKLAAANPVAVPGTPATETPKVATAADIVAKLAAAEPPAEEKKPGVAEVMERLKGKKDDEKKEEGKEKEASDEALRAARAILVAAGIDPTSGEKVAGIQITPEVETAALALLKQHGYL